MVLKKFNRVAHGVFDEYRLNGIIGIRNVDFQLAVMAYPAGIEFQVMPTPIGNLFYIEEQRVIQALLRHVLHRNGTIQPVPTSADEMRSYRFGHIDGAITGDVDMRIEILYA